MIAAYYAHTVWKRIPFAAVNLKTAISAVNDSIEVIFYAYKAVVILLIWTFFWSIATVTTLVQEPSKEENNAEDPKLNRLFLVLFFLSFYWTQQVISNVVHGK